MKARFFLCCFFLFWQDCSKDITSVTETDTGRIKGWVVNAGWEAVGGADVILRNPGVPPESTITSSEGFFSFDSVDTGKYYLEVNDHDTGGAVVEVTLGKEALDLVMDTVLVRQFGTIAGSLDRTLVKNDSTFIYLIEIDRKIPVDSLGLFLISNVPARDYTIRLVENESIVPSPLDTMTVYVAERDTFKAYRIGSKSGTVTIDGTIIE